VALHSGFDAPASETGGDFIAGLNLFGIFHQISFSVKHQGIAAVEDGHGRKRFEAATQMIQV